VEVIKGNSPNSRDLSNIVKRGEENGVMSRGALEAYGRSGSTPPRRPTLGD